MLSKENKTMNNNYKEQKDILIGYFLEIDDDKRIKKDIKENILNCLEINIDKLDKLILSKNLGKIKQ
tara:strand:+ start:88 stop:288 length:201 start_codon:yes stop_codon:yes gene_type:complete